MRRKKIKLTLKEYAKICLECPYTKCCDPCSRISPYRVESNIDYSTYVNRKEDNNEKTKEY